MRNYIERRRASEKGFTLIELLVVIVILGILAAVVVFAVGGLQDKGQDNACKIDRRTIRTAAEAYFSQNDTYAATEGDLVPDFMDEESSLYDYAGTGTAYTVTPVTGGKCDT